MSIAIGSQRPPSHRVWQYGLIAVLLITALVRWHRVGIPMERDEGEYAYAGQLLLQGVPPYVLVYNMKLPGIYLVYAIIEGIFGQTLEGIHFGLLVVNLASIFLVYQLGRRLTDERGAFFSAALFAMLSSHWSVTGLFANSEHFVVLPVLGGAWFLVTALQQGGLWRWGMSGVLMGTGFVIKQHGIMFVAFGASVIVMEGLRTRPISTRDVLSRLTAYALGNALPFVGICLWMAASGVFSRFWFWTFTYSPHYVAQTPLKLGGRLLYYQLSHMFRGELIPIWFLPFLGMIGTFVDPELKKWRSVWWMWSLFSVLAVCPGLYFRGHYFLFVLPICSLLGGAAVSMFSRRREDSQPRLPISTAAGFILAIAVIQQRDFLIQLPDKDVVRLIHGLNAFAESPEIGEYIRKNSMPEDTMAVIGSEPQLYFYSQRRSATGYIYMYPLMEQHPFCQEMQKEMIQQIDTTKPRFIVYVNVRDSWLRGKEPYSNLRDWYPGYLATHYELVGLVEIQSESARFRWDQEVQGVSLPETNDAWVSIYRRKIDVP